MNQAFVYDAVRTPFGKFGSGLAGVRPDDLAAHVISESVKRAPGLDPEFVDHVPMAVIAFPFGHRSRL